jgi:hypothetical protein
MAPMYLFAHGLIFAIIEFIKRRSARKESENKDAVNAQ